MTPSDRSSSYAGSCLSTSSDDVIERKDSETSTNTSVSRDDVTEDEPNGKKISISGSGMADGTTITEGQLVEDTASVFVCTTSGFDDSEDSATCTSESDCRQRQSSLSTDISTSSSPFPVADIDTSSTSGVSDETTGSGAVEGDCGSCSGSGEAGTNELDIEGSTFTFLGWDVMNSITSKQHVGCHRVLVLKDPCVVLMFKASCTTEKVGNDARLLNLMADIAENCAKRLRQMREITLPNLSAQHMDTLPLNDGRTTKEHLAEISHLLNESVTLTDIAYRFQPSDGSYIGTFVQGTVLSRRNYAIGKVGVLAVLVKKSKFATVEAFSEQLCEHIAHKKPATLGSFMGDRKAGRSSQRHAHLERDQLLLQSFMFDQTIIVAEAARRCFVGIEDFLYFC